MDTWANWRHVSAAMGPSQNGKSWESMRRLAIQNVENIMSMRNALLKGMLRTGLLGALLLCQFSFVTSGKASTVLIKTGFVVGQTLAGSASPSGHSVWIFAPPNSDTVTLKVDGAGLLAGQQLSYFITQEAKTAPKKNSPFPRQKGRSPNASFARQIINRHAGCTPSGSVTQTEWPPTSPLFSLSAFPKVMLVL